VEKQGGPRQEDVLPDEREKNFRAERKNPGQGKRGGYGAKKKAEKARNGGGGKKRPAWGACTQRGKGEDNNWGKGWEEDIRKKALNANRAEKLSAIKNANRGEKEDWYDEEKRKIWWRGKKGPGANPSREKEKMLKDLKKRRKKREQSRGRQGQAMRKKKRFGKREGITQRERRVIQRWTFMCKRQVKKMVTEKETQGNFRGPETEAETGKGPERGQRSLERGPKLRVVGWG